MKKYLKLIGFFSGFSDEELDGFSEAANVITTKKNEFIIKENDEGKGLFFIVRGDFLAVKEIEDKKFKRLRKLESGEFFGEMSLLTNENNSASIISNEDGTLVHLSKEAFEDLTNINLHLSFSIMKKLAIILSERLQNMNLKYGMAVGQLQAE